MLSLKSFNPGPGPNSIAGTASTKLLHGSDMDDLTVMLRESVQNSWDAREDSNAIRYTFTGIVLSNHELQNLRICIGEHEYGKKVVDCIEENDRCAIQIADTGTFGLAGDTTYDNNHSELSRFLKFVFEVGNTRQGAGAGGSFGYGKASLYKVSKVGTLAIYSRIRIGTAFEERFIIKSINRFDNFDDTSSGVYWWGDRIHTPADDSCARSILPVTGNRANEIAKSLGMRTLQGSETGTVLLVYEPYLNINPDETENETHGFPSLYSEEYDKLLDVTTLMQRASVHYFWAKYPRNSRGIHFEFSVRDSSGKTKSLEMVSPQNISPYNKLITCLDAAKENISETIENNNRKVIRVYRPQADLGVLAWVELTEKDINPSYFSFFEPLKSRIALMRNIEFVVKYLEVDIDLPAGDTDHSRLIMGVFRTLQGKKVSRHREDTEGIELEEVYRAAENQTHGEWYYQNVRELGSNCTTYIKQTPKKIEEALKGVYPDIQQIVNHDNGRLDADNMILLGQFINGIQGGGKPTENVNPPKPGRNGVGGPKPTLDYVRNDGINRNGAVIESRHVFRLKNPDIHKHVRLYPVCPDEDGGMKIRGTEKASLPVSLTDLAVLDNDGSLVKKYINNNGTITLKSDMTEYIISVSTVAVTDCRYAVNIESLEFI